MKNKKGILITLISSLTFVLCAQSVEKAFIDMPDAYYLSLPSAQRKEMIKAFKTDTNAVRKNRFRGESVITQIDSSQQFLSVKNSNNGKVSLKILNSTSNNNVSYYALIFTACAPICDSHIGFYSSNWEFLAKPLIPTIKIQDFLNEDKIKAEGKTVDEIAGRFEIVFIETHFINNGNTIEAVLNSEKYIEEENFTRLKPYLKGDKISYLWANDSYSKDKCYW